MAFSTSTTTKYTSMASSTSTTSLVNFPSFSRTKTFHSNSNNIITFPSSTKFPLRLASCNSTRYNEVVQSKRRRTVHLTPRAVEAIAAISHDMATLLPSFMHNACLLMAFLRDKSNVIQDFNIKVVGWAIQVGAIWATVAEPAFGVTGVNEEEDLIWVLIQLGISAFVYFIVVPPITMNWLRIRWYRRNLLEMYLQFMFVFMFFPGVLLWAPFLNFRKFPRDPSMKYPWSVPQDPSQIKGGFLKYPWAQPEDYE